MKAPWKAIDVTALPCCEKRAGSCATRKTHETQFRALFVDLLARGEQPGDLPLLYRALTHRCLNWLRDEKNRARLLQREVSLLRGAHRVAPDTLSLGLDALLKLQLGLDETVMEAVVYRFVDELGLEEIPRRSCR